MIFGEALRTRTGGGVDLLANEKINRIARYPMAVYLGNNCYASFADSRPKYTVQPVLAAKLRERTGYEGLMALVGESSGGQLPGALGDLIWWDGTEAGEPELEDVFMPVSGLVKKVGMLTEKPLVVMAKAGHNAEPHNQNDVGSFIVHIGASDYLCDPGAGKYDDKYFTDERYKNIFANSFGHSVPRIGGHLQSLGAPSCGKLLEREGKAFAIDFTKAYDVPGLTRLVREVKLGADVLSMEDQFVFSGDPVEFESALVTWFNVETEGNRAYVDGPEGRLEICAGDLFFSAERLADACAANAKERVLTRLSVTHSPAHEGAVRFAMRLLPKV